MIFNKCTYFRYDKCKYFRYAYHRALRIVVVIPAILKRVKESVASPLRLRFSYLSSSQPLHPGLIREILI